MSIEERNQKRTELNDELNVYKRKWNIVELNRSMWGFLKERLKRGQLKSQKSTLFHFSKSLKLTLLGLIFILLRVLIPFALPVAIGLFCFSGIHIIKTIISLYCFHKLRKGVTATEKINDKYVEKMQEIEKKEEKIYAKIDLLNMDNYLASDSLFQKCIERNADLSQDEELSIM